MHPRSFTRTCFDSVLDSGIAGIVCSNVNRHTDRHDPRSQRRDSSGRYGCDHEATFVNVLGADDTSENLRRAYEMHFDYIQTDHQIRLRDIIGGSSSILKTLSQED